MALKTVESNNLETIVKRLQSLDPEFKTRKLNPTEIQPLYPDFVIAVGSFKEIFPAKVRTQSLDEALDIVQDLCSRRRVKFTVVISEGIFINQIFNMITRADEDFCLEIIGVNDVVFAGDHAIGVLGTVLKKVVIRNVYVIDQRTKCEVPYTGAVNAVQNACLELDGVMLHSSDNPCVTGFMGSPDVILRNCRILDSRQSFSMEDRSQLILEGCHFSHSRVFGGSAKENTRVTALRVTFFNFQGFSFDDQAVINLFECQLEGSWKNRRLPKNKRSLDPDSFAFLLTNGVNVTAQRCRFSDFGTMAKSQGNGTKFTMENSKIERCRRAVSCWVNGSATLRNNDIDVEVLAETCFNKDGSIVIKENRIANLPAKLEMDVDSKMPDHDIKKIQVRRLLNIAKPGMDMKDRSKYTEERLKEAFVHPQRPDARGDLDLKRCFKCGRVEISSGEKHKYCKACKRVCYCSKPCQKADWKNHKLICESLAFDFKF